MDEGGFLSSLPPPQIMDSLIKFTYLELFKLTISVVIYYSFCSSITNAMGIRVKPHIIPLSALTSSALHHQQNGPIFRPRYRLALTLTRSPTTRSYNSPILPTRPRTLDNKMCNLPLRHSRIPHHPSTHPHRLLPPLSLPRSLLLRIAGGEIPWRIGVGADCAIQ